MNEKNYSMELIDEYRNPELVKDLIKCIKNR